MSIVRSGMKRKRNAENEGRKLINKKYYGYAYTNRLANRMLIQNVEGKGKKERMKEGRSESQGNFHVTNQQQR